MADNLRKNAEGYNDPTAYEGIMPLIREEKALDRKVGFLIKVLRYIINESGFDLIDTIKIKDRKSGRVYRLK
jgi:hypothetical protein